MLTGTPLDLTPFGVVLQGIGLLYWLLVIAALALVLIKVKGGRWAKLLSVVAVLAIMVGPVALHVMKRHEQQQLAKARLDAAIARFEMRCKSAGEKIVRTADNVDGIVWMKWRSEKINFDDQFKLDDPYGNNCSLEGCILQLLHPARQQTVKRQANGYRFVETIDPRDGIRYRYTGEFKQIRSVTKEEFSRHVESTGYGAEEDGNYFSLKREPIDRYSARYGITWDDISTYEDREHWIAGGSLTIIDLRTNEVIAERVGYMIDRGLGSTAGFRSPWAFATNNACPEFTQVGPSDPRRIHTGKENTNFIFQILHTTQGK